MAFFIASGKLHHFCLSLYKMGIMVLRAFGKLFKDIMKMIEQLNGMAAGCYLCVQILLVVTWEHRKQYKRVFFESSALVLCIADNLIIQTSQKTCQTPY